MLSSDQGGLLFSRTNPNAGRLIPGDAVDPVVMRIEMLEAGADADL